VEWKSGTKYGTEWGKEKEQCDQDGLLKSRRMGEHDDGMMFLSVCLFVGIPKLQAILHFHSCFR
jgi:hypothetical protein